MRFLKEEIRERHFSYCKRHYPMNKTLKMICGQGNGRKSYAFLKILVG